MGGMEDKMNAILNAELKHNHSEALFMAVDHRDDRILLCSPEERALLMQGQSLCSPSGQCVRWN